MIQTYKATGAANVQALNLILHSLVAPLGPADLLNDFGVITTTQICVFVGTFLVFWIGNLFEVFGEIFLRCLGKFF